MTLSAEATIANAGALIDLLAVLHDAPDTPLRQLAFEKLDRLPLEATRTPQGTLGVDVSAFVVPSVILLEGLLELLQGVAVSRQDALAQLRTRVALITE